MNREETRVSWPSPYWANRLREGVTSSGGTMAKGITIITANATATYETIGVGGAGGTLPSARSEQKVIKAIRTPMTRAATMIWSVRMREVRKADSSTME